jgi:hypothetical protein
MQNIELWNVVPDEHGVRDAVLIPVAPSDETERLLEDLIVRRPSLLGRGMALVGRQLPTVGGPLDLLGIDQEGRVVVFELKRGALTRDAVAQVLDYASDLTEKGEEHLARLIETNSGRDGIPLIEDFVDWYGQQYPDSDGPLAQHPRMILVGLGVDDRARRVTSFLAQHSVDIRLLTFHAFRSGDRLLMARLVESEGPKQGSTSPTVSKESNRRALHEAAEQLGVKELLDDVVSFVAARLPGAYQLPGKTSYAFYLQEQTDARKPALRAYITIYLDARKKGVLLFNITPRAARAGSTAVSALVQSLGTERVRSPTNQYVEHEVIVTASLWVADKPAFDAALAAIYVGWQKSATADNAALNLPHVQTN